MLPLHIENDIQYISSTSIYNIYKWPNSVNYSTSEGASFPSFFFLRNGGTLNQSSFSNKIQASAHFDMKILKQFY